MRLFCFGGTKRRLMLFLHRTLCDGRSIPCSNTASARDRFVPRVEGTLYLRCCIGLVSAICEIFCVSMRTVSTFVTGAGAVSCVFAFRVGDRSSGKPPDEPRVKRAALTQMSCVGVTQVSCVVIH